MSLTTWKVRVAGRFQSPIINKRKQYARFHHDTTIYHQVFSYWKIALLNLDFQW